MSNVALRYLGFPVIHSIKQRQWAEEELLTLVRSQCELFSQRSPHYGVEWLSSTRLFWPNYGIRSKWLTFRRGIEPGFRYAQFCATRDEGDLGLLDPQVQQHCLVSRWSKLVPQSSANPSLCQQYLQHTIRRFFSKGSPTLLSCFFPSLRSSVSLEYGSIIPSLFQTLDLILKNVNFANTMCTPATLACLPLHSLFADVPANHWILARRLHIPLVDHFFTFDPIRHCFRPLTRSD
ncbi:hypothetical protein EDC96DRAFT_574164 [Choanephora cucurbitarum]|nr:hypothetical protein EDC96DRAFT_574164 [Choanephora cucurbitarum]